MIPQSALQRTFFIKYGSATGTCFTLDVDTRQYLITARHVVEGIADTDSIELFHNNAWRLIDCELAGIGRDDADVAVLSLPEQLSSDHHLPADDKNYFLGQDAYFLGFPYGLRAEIGAPNKDYPIPFAKKCIISSFSTDSNGVKHIYLDGHNNPGFSGGPVIYSSPNQHDFRVAAVISGFRFENEPIYIGAKQTALAYRYNTGIIVSYGIRHVVEIISAKPIGYQI